MLRVREREGGKYFALELHVHVHVPVIRTRRGTEIECYESHQPGFVMVTETVGSCPSGVTGPNGDEREKY